MQKNKKIKYITIASIAILIVVLGIVLFIVANADKTKIYDNVRVISNENGEIDSLLYIEENSLIFKENPGYATGDVLVSGITENTPGGFIRKVVSVSQEGDQYILETEPGLITDVFEEVHIEKTFILSDEGATEVESSGIGYSNSFNDIITSSVATATGITRANDPLFDDDGDYVFNVEEEFDIANVLSVETEVGFGLQLDFKLEIEKGDVVLGLTVHNAVGGEIFLGLSEELKKEFEKELLSLELPSIQFMAGYVPVVITNEMFVNFEGEASVSGKLGTTIEIQAEKIVGFEYNSATDKVVEINEDNYLADGMKWSVGGSVKGEVEVGVYIHLASKLYDSTGIDLAVGIEGSASAELASSVDTDGSYEDCVGRIDLEVGPELEGSIVVTFPIIDYELADLEIFKTDLPAFWEEHWVSGENWQEELAMATGRHGSEESQIEEISESGSGQSADESSSDDANSDSDYLGSGNSACIQIEGNQINLPIRVSELEELGFVFFDPYSSSYIVSNETIKSNIRYNGFDGKELGVVYIYNPNDTMMLAKDCYVVCIDILGFGEAQRADAYVLDEIRIGTSEEVVKEIYERDPYKEVEPYFPGTRVYCIRVMDEQGMMEVAYDICVADDVGVFEIVAETYAFPDYIGILN